MDVVPYISGVTTELSAGYKKRPTVLSRSALGYYPVRRGSNITVEGFNLNGTSTTVSIGGTNFTPATGTTQNSLVVSIGSGTTFMNGDITAKVGTVTSLNNENNNAATGDYNTEPNGQNNDILTDDRKVYVVDVYTTTNTSDKRKLDMEIYNNTVNFSAGYQDSFFAIMRGASGASIGTVNTLRGSYTRYFDNRIAYNESGTPFTVSACGDTYGVPVSQWSNGPSHFALTRGTSGTTGNDEYSNSDNKRKLYLASNWNGASLNNLDRFQWPDLVVTGNDANTKGYISYYDSTHKMIEFRYFKSDGTKVASNMAAYTAGSTPGQGTEGAVRTDLASNQGYMAIAGADGNSPYSAVGVTPSGAALVSWYDATEGALKLKYNTGVASSYSGYQSFRTLPNTGTVTFKIAVDGGAAKDVSVNWSNVANGTRNYHEFAYQLNAVLSNGYGAYAEVDPASTAFQVVVRSMQTGTGSSIAITNLSSGAVNNAVAGAGSAWNEVIVDSESAGQYVAMKTDSRNGIHFAYYDTANGDLKYAYMSSVTAEPVVVTVDGYQQVGQYVDLAIREGETVDGKSCIVPYIGYYSMSNADTTRSVKVARLAKPLIPVTGTATITEENAKGSEDELFTGNWETMHVPTNGVPAQYRVNIGVTTAGNVYVGYLADRIIEYVKVF